MTIQFNQVKDGYASGAKVTLSPAAEQAYVTGGFAAFVVAEPIPGGVGVLPIRGPIVITPIATVGTGVLTAAGLVGGVITRSGSTAGYADATDTAANIVAALPASQQQVGVCFDVTVVNSVAFADTITGGTGVTLAGTTAIAASTWRRYIGQVTALSPAPLVTLTGIGSGTL